ncbi:MAG TPA: D-sedoheptulose 7-phosphate isomerase [Telmatospirillum sp.]|nr:D-sedoheptulose 7-phosphate isomerase [Telmatospirillum sp.]
MSLALFFDTEVAEHAKLVQILGESVKGPFLRLCEICQKSLQDGGKILFFGNGGSAADAQHLATEIVVRYKLNRRALAAIALTTDTSILTATANDYSFEDIFSRQVEALARPGDVAIGISTSGTSPNILKALSAAKTAGAVAAGFTGRDGGAMVGLADPVIVVPSFVTARIQEMHILIGHMLCEAIEASVA